MGGGGVPVHNMTSWNVGELPVPPIIQRQADGMKQRLGSATAESCSDDTTRDMEMNLSRANGRTVAAELPKFGTTASET